MDNAICTKAQNNTQCSIDSIIGKTYFVIFNSLINSEPTVDGGTVIKETDMFCTSERVEYSYIKIFIIKATYTKITFSTTINSSIANGVIYKQID